MNPRHRLIGALFAATAVLSACSTPPLVDRPAAESATESLPTGPSPAAQAAKVDPLIQGLSIKGKGPKTGYSRAEFGPAWKDVARVGCDTRNQILKRDLTGVTVKPGTRGCLVLSGVLNDPYTGRTISFVRGTDTSRAVEIDHVVPLALAWQQGASAWDVETRERFANDPRNLLAVDGPSNSQKRDSEISAWLPPNKAFRCDYVASVMTVKAAYGLSITPAELATARSVLNSCGA